MKVSLDIHNKVVYTLPGLPLVPEKVLLLCFGETMHDISGHLVVIVYIVRDHGQ